MPGRDWLVRPLSWGDGQPVRALLSLNSALSVGPILNAATELCESLDREVESLYDRGTTSNKYKNV